MLSGALVRVRIQGKELTPSFVDPDREKIQDRAAELLGLYRDGVALGRSRGELEQAVKELIGDGVDHKLTHGLARMLVDRAEFETASPLPPKELRERVFQAASQAPSREAADRAYAQLALELDCQAELLRRCLFADRKEEQQIQRLRVPDAAWLVRRYNVALVQACLLRAAGIRVSLSSPAPEKVRQLLRYVGFHQLMHSARMEGSTFILDLDGPTSLLRQSTRYGMALANFFPALLLQTGAWQLTASLRWGKRRLRKQMVVGSERGLVSHYKEQGGYRTRTEQWFEERWERLDSGWTLERSTTLVKLGGQGLLCPSYTLRKDGRVAHLEILGFWRKAWLRKHLRAVQKHGPGNLVLAVSSKMEGAKEGLGSFEGKVVAFKEVVPAKEVLAAVQSIARPAV